MDHPSQWPLGGYSGIQSPRKKNVLIDYDKLMGLLGVQSYDKVKQLHKMLTKEELAADRIQRQEKWTITLY
ncbi:MAG: hypothetical protein U9R57_05300 [Thermodesulfobacteriota bacterium]|nr:hypothetical protein [Thermodesulfobacteriota bacterium]